MFLLGCQACSLHSKRLNQMHRDMIPIHREHVQFEQVSKRGYFAVNAAVEWKHRKILVLISGNHRWRLETKYSQVIPPTISLMTQ